MTVKPKDKKKSKKKGFDASTAFAGGAAGAKCVRML